MPGRARVHELAQELGIPTQQVLRLLDSLGESVVSASSTMEGPLVRRLRQHYASGIPATPPAPAPAHRLRIGNNPFTAPPRIPPRPVQPPRSRAPLPGGPRAPRPVPLRSTPAPAAPNNSFAPAPTADPFAALPLPGREVTHGPSGFWAKEFTPTQMEQALLRYTILPDRSESTTRNANGRYTADEVKQARAAARKWAEMMMFTEPEPTEVDVLSWISLYPTADPADVARFHAAGVAAEEVKHLFGDKQTNPRGVSLFEGFDGRPITAGEVIANVRDYRSRVGSTPPSD